MTSQGVSFAALAALSFYLAAHVLVGVVLLHAPALQGDAPECAGA